MLKCFKQYSEQDPEGAKETYNNMRQEMADTAGVDLKTLQSAETILLYDGWFGPCSNETYSEEGHSITKEKARRIIKYARTVNFGDVSFFDPDYACECCEGSNFNDDEDFICEGKPNVKIEGRTIYNEMWKWYVEIYGS